MKGPKVCFRRVIKISWDTVIEIMQSLVPVTKRFGRSLQETQRRPSLLLGLQQKDGSVCDSDGRMIVGDIGAFNSDDWRHFRTRILHGQMMAHV